MPSSSLSNNWNISPKIAAVLPLLISSNTRYMSLGFSVEDSSIAFKDFYKAIVNGPGTKLYSNSLPLFLVDGVINPIKSE